MPPIDTPLIGELILPYLDLGVGDGTRIGMGGNRKVRAVHDVRLIFADAQVPVLAKARQKPQSEAHVAAVIQYARMPRSDNGSQLRRKAMQRDQYRLTGETRAFIQVIGDGGLIGFVDGYSARSPCIGIKAAIAGNESIVAYLWDCVRRARRSIAVNHQPRVMLVNEGRIEAVSQLSTKRPYADVPGNVATQVTFAQAKHLQLRGNRVSRMVSQEEEWRTSARIVDYDRRWIVSGQKGIVH